MADRRGRMSPVEFVRALWRELYPSEFSDRILLFGFVFIGLLGATFISIYWTSITELPRVIVPGFYVVAIFVGVGAYALFALFVRGSAALVYGSRQTWDPQPLRRDDLMDRARQAEREERYADAVELYRDVLRHGLAENPWFIWFRIATIYDEGLVDVRRAIVAYRRSVDLQRDARQEAIGRGEEVGEEEPLIDRCMDRLKVLGERAQDIERGVPARREEIMALVGKGGIDEARRRVDRMHEEHPDDAENNYLKGYVLSRSGSYALGVDYYERAIALDPDHLRARYNLAAALDVLDRDRDAIAAYESYLSRARGEPGEEDWVIQAEAQVARVRQHLARDLVETRDAPPEDVE